MESKFTKPLLGGLTGHLTKNVSAQNSYPEFVLAPIHTHNIHLLNSMRLLNNKFRGLSSSGGCVSLSFDQGVPKNLPTTAPSSQLERHLTVFCIDQIVPGYVVYYLNCVLS